MCSFCIWNWEKSINKIRTHFPVVHSVWLSCYVIILSKNRTNRSNISVAIHRQTDRRTIQSVRWNKRATRTDNVSKVAERTELNDTANTNIQWRYQVMSASGTKRIQPNILQTGRTVRGCCWIGGYDGIVVTLNIAGCELGEDTCCRQNVGAVCGKKCQQSNSRLRWKEQMWILPQKLVEFCDVH